MKGIGMGTLKRALNRVTAVTIGFVLMVVGLAMMVTIVMLPAGVVIGLLGVMMMVFGFFFADERPSSAR